MAVEVRRSRRFRAAPRTEELRGRPKHDTLRSIFAPALAQIVAFKSAGDKNVITAERLRQGLRFNLTDAVQEALAAGYEPEMGDHAKFAIVAFADEVVVMSDWVHREEWMTVPLQKEEFDTTIAGNQFFERLEAAGKMDPELAEIYFLILSLGFQGQYAGMPTELETVRRRLFKSFPPQAIQMSAKLTPEAYEERIDGLKGNEPGLGRWKWLVIGILLGILGLTYGILQWRVSSAVSEYRQALVETTAGR